MNNVGPVEKQILEEIRQKEMLDRRQGWEKTEEGCWKKSNDPNGDRKDEE